MLPKYKSKEYILDKLHRGFVNTCVAVTIISGSMLSYKIYEYIRYVRPLHKTLQLKAQEELLAEGKPLEDASIEVS
ncbi:uncharacterized protein LOC143185472 [Calliopsis andreniformis]|uniref:uncharacterized protein LOC143185472 n=1 Tax=Calliopsis andreniformis TaxID=337506 RepID=UPI003FCEA9ED